MRILVLNYEFPPLGGGASPVSYEIARGFADYGHEVEVVTMGFSGLKKSERVSPNFKIHRVYSARRKKEISYPHEQLIYVFGAFLKARKLHQRKKFDLCHAHFFLPTGLVSLALKKFLGIKYFITSHGSDVPHYNPDRFKYLYFLSRPFFKKIYNEAEVITAPSLFLKNFILENFSFTKKEKIIYLPNGINPGLFLPQNKQKIILSIGRFLSMKGFRTLLNAVKDQDLGYEVHLCGAGHDEPILKNIAKSSKTKIVFHGWLENFKPEFKDLLARAAIYCLVAKRENANRTLLEAMSTGCAIVTSNVSGCAETIGEAGIKISPDEPRLLNKTFLDLVNNPSKISQLQKLARERFLDKFNFKKIMLDYLSLINKIA